MRYWECAPGGEDDPCPRCVPEDDFDADELGLDPEESYDA
jgi:hypothetical protein